MIKRYLFQITLTDHNQNFGETLEKIKKFLNERDGVETWNCFVDEMEKDSLENAPKEKKA